MGVVTRGRPAVLCLAFLVVVGPAAASRPAAGSQPEAGSRARPTIRTQALPQNRTLRNDRVGYSLSYPRGWKVGGRAVATEFAARADCQSVRVVDLAAPADAGPGAEVRQSLVQMCWKRVGDGASLDEFMRQTYGGRLSELFEWTRLAGVPAYRAKDGASRTFFLQTEMFRLQVVATVVAGPARRAERLAQVNRILTSFSLTR